jgi:hypothetical protein
MSTKILKEVFIDFFNKILPALYDPSDSIKKSWKQFKELLLDEKKSIEEVSEFVKKMSTPIPFMSFTYF